MEAGNAALKIRCPSYLAFDKDLSLFAINGYHCYGYSFSKRPQTL
jgi:hypothetical protein